MLRAMDTSDVTRNVFLGLLALSQGLVLFFLLRTLALHDTVQTLQTKAMQVESDLTHLHDSLDYVQRRIEQLEKRR